MKNKEIISAVVGGVFFAVPYLGLSIALAPALAIGCGAFGASELVLSGIKPKETLKNTDRKSYLKVNNAKKVAYAKAQPVAHNITVTPVAQ